MSSILKCRLVDYLSLMEKFYKIRGTNGIQYRSDMLQPGDLYYCPWYTRKEIGKKDLGEGKSQLIYNDSSEWLPKDECTEILSSYYMNDHYGKRNPIMVMLPSREEWCVDQKSSNSEGWQVTGEPPYITCHPSINANNYHGFLTNGEFSEDTEDRTYSFNN